MQSPDSRWRESHTLYILYPEIFVQCILLETQAQVPVFSYKYCPVWHMACKLPYKAHFALL